MVILSSVLGGGANGLISGVANAVDRFVETPDEKAAADLKARALEMEPLLKQMAINEQEAKHASVFVAGARPATLWLCAVAMAGIVGAGVFGWWTGKDVSDLFALYGSTVAPAHLGLLGLRTYERSAGRERNAINPPKK